MFVNLLSGKKQPSKLAKLPEEHNGILKKCYLDDIKRAKEEIRGLKGRDSERAKTRIETLIKQIIVLEKKFIRNSKGGISLKPQPSSNPQELRQILFEKIPNDMGDELIEKQDGFGKTKFYGIIPEYFLVLGMDKRMCNIIEYMVDTIGENDINHVWDGAIQDDLQLAIRSTFKVNDGLSNRNAEKLLGDRREKIKNEDDFWNALFEVLLDSEKFLFFIESVQNQYFYIVNEAYNKIYRRFVKGDTRSVLDGIISNDAPKKSKKEIIDEQLAREFSIKLV